MTSKELIEEVRCDFLWEVVGNITEEVENLPNLLKDINYLDDIEIMNEMKSYCLELKDYEYE